MASKVVTFLQDVYPYCKGDVRRLETTVLAEIDKVAKARKLGSVYSEGEKDVATVEGDVEAGVKAAKAALAQGLPSVRAAVTSADVTADHIEKTILGDGSVGVEAAPVVDSVEATTGLPAGQAAETIPAVKGKPAAKASATTTTTTSASK
jgi:hypothetical protein